MTAAEPGQAGPLQVVSFALEGKTLAVEIGQVQEIIRMVEITPVPKMPPFALGVINLRGRIVPIIDIRERLGLPHRDPTQRTCIMLVHAGKQLLGFLVDDVAEVLSLPREAIERTDDNPEVISSEIFAGVGKLSGRLLVIIDTGRLLSPKEEKQLLKASSVPLSDKD